MGKKQNAFMGCHPVLQFLYFTVVILTTMLVDHPVVLVLSFLGAILYNLQLYRFKEVMKSQFSFVVPLFLIVILINTLFNHYGVTVLCYIHTGAVTLEAIVYGIVLAFMLWTSIIWFSGVNRVLTTDRLIYLFGRIMPSISLVLSMVLRFVPRFTKQYGVIHESRKCMGMGSSGNGLRQKIRSAFSEFSILVTWSLENGVDTADSMRARGYGMRRRTSYAIFCPCKRDILSAILLIAFYGVCLLGFWRGYAFSNYNPKITFAGIPFTWRSGIVYLMWGMFCLFPTLLSVWDKMIFGRNRRRMQQRDFVREQTAVLKE